MTMSLTGCGTLSGEKTTNQEKQLGTQEIVLPVFENDNTYSMPSSYVHVLTDRQGYQTEREKLVYFLGDELADEFYLIDRDKEEIVYTGKIEKSVSPAFGDFSEFQRNGTYYIETEIVGRSYSFSISDDVFTDLLAETLQLDGIVSLEQNAENICQVSLGLHILLLGLENRGNVIDKDSELVGWIMKVTNWLMTCQQENGSIMEDYEATAAYCGMLTMCSDFFGKYDASMNREYDKAIQSAKKWMEQSEETAEDALFYATAADFHANHTPKSNDYVTGYLLRHKGTLSENFYRFLGAVMYLSAEKGTDRDVCNQIMQELVDQTESICRTSEQYNKEVHSSEISEMMRNMLLISFVDYVTPSNEYAVVMENYIHFLAGRNETGENLLPSGGVWAENEMTKDSSLIWNAVLINCLCGLIGDKA